MLSARGQTLALVILLHLGCFTGLVEAGSFELIEEWVSLPFDWDDDVYNRTEAYWSTQGWPNTSCLAGVKVGFDSTVYVTVPRWQSGVPSTLNSVVDGVLKPFPSWDFNEHTVRNCQSMLIDSQNRMWILDVGRENFFDPSANTINAPAKVLVLDLDTNEINEKLSYEFPEDVVSYNNSFINDLVIDETHGFVYIANTWADGGILVYDYLSNASWMFTGYPTELDPSLDVIVNGYDYGSYHTRFGNSPSDGIALSEDLETLYWTSVQGLQIWSIETSILRSSLTTNGEFLAATKRAGNKTGVNDGMIILDETLYYGGNINSALVGFSLDLSAEEVLEGSAVLGQNLDNYRWIDTFAEALDGAGTLYFSSNKLDKFFNGSMSMGEDAEPNFRIYLFSEGSPQPSPLPTAQPSPLPTPHPTSTSLPTSVPTPLPTPLPSPLPTAQPSHAYPGGLVVGTCISALAVLVVVAVIAKAKYAKRDGSSAKTPTITPTANPGLI